MSQPENFAIFQPLVAATLWLAARGLRGDVRAYVLAGLLVGIASLARNDAFLLGAAVGLVFVIDRWRAWRAGRPAHLPLVAAVGCFALYLVVVGPWFARQLLEFGSISPTSSTGQALWLTEYRQWNSITAETTLATFLAAGPAVILETRLTGLSRLAGQLHRAHLVDHPAAPPAHRGAGRGGTRTTSCRTSCSSGCSCSGATIIFPLHVPGGAFIHTAVGLGPHTLHPRPRGRGHRRRLAGARRRKRWDPVGRDPDLHLGRRRASSPGPRCCTPRSSTPAGTRPGRRAGPSPPSSTGWPCPPTTG